MSEHIPKDFIELLLAKIDIVDLIDQRVPLQKKSGSNYFACCPFHTEKSPSFSASQTKQFFYCFGCGAHGNAIDFLMQYDRFAFPEAVETLAKQIGMEIPREARHSGKKTSFPELFQLLEALTKYYQTELRQHTPAIDYLKNRGILGTLAKQFALGFALPGWDHLLQQFGQTAALKQQLLDTGMLIKKDDGGCYDRFRDRIMFPIHNHKGQVIGFGGRIIDQGEPKYLNSPETVLFQKGHELYGLYHALQANRQLPRLLIVEGYMDVISLFQHDITYTVATLGTATTANHLQRLFRYTTEIIFCFDGDNAGRTAAWRALQVTLPLMRDGIQIRFMFLPDREDPDSFIRKIGKIAFEKHIEAALTISEFFFQAVANQSDLSSPDGRARFVKLAMEHLQRIPDSIFQQMMLDELAKKARIDQEKLKQPKQTVAAKQKSISLRARPPSALRLAIALLIQQPELAMSFTETLPKVNAPGFDILEKLLALAQEKTHLTTGALLEFWRDKPEEKFLAKLAHFEHMIPPQGIQQEFLGAIQRVKKFALQEMIDHLLSKAALGHITSEEKLELQALVQNK